MTWQVGSWMFDPVDRPSWHNASFTVIHIDGLTDRQQFNSRMQSLIDEIHNAPPAAGSDGVLLPGELEFRTARKADEHGIALPADVRAKLREAAALAEVPLPEAV